MFVIDIIWHTFTRENFKFNKFNLFSCLISRLTGDIADKLCNKIPMGIICKFN